MRSDDAVYAILTLLPVLLILGLLLSRLWKRGAPEKREEPESARDGDSRSSVYRVAEPAEVEGPRCIACGDVATHSMPRLARGRGSAIEDYFGMPPRYRRVVPNGAAHTLCRSHAGVADGELASFIAMEVRAPFLKAAAQVAARVAAFESEELLARIGSSLTEAQRRAAKRVPTSGSRETSPVRLVNGTDG